MAALAVAVARSWPAGWRLGGTVLTLAGLSTVIWGVFTFDPWTFAGYVPALMAVGLLTLFARIASPAAPEPHAPEKSEMKLARPSGERSRCGPPASRPPVLHPPNGAP